MSAHESLIDEEIVAVKIAAVLDYVLGKMDQTDRAALPPITPTITAEFLELHSGDVLVVAIPLWWLHDPTDALLPDLERHLDTG